MAQICLVNLTELDPPVNGGSARVAQAVCQMLLAHRHPGLRLVFVVKWNFAGQFAAWVGHNDGDVDVIPYIDASDSVGRVFQRLQPDFIISPLFGMKPFRNPSDFPDVPHVASVLDALPLDKPHLFSPVELQGRREIYTHMQSASKLVTISAYARLRLIHHTNIDESRIEVAYLGADIHPDAESQPINAAIVPAQPYIFYPANDWPHKRHELLFQTMTHIWQTRPDVNLVLTGGRKQNRLPELRQRYVMTSERVIDRGYVSDTELKTLYQGAEAMLFTSEHEGFGMPVVEAMQNQCPVICAPLTAIPEIAGDAALYVDADDPAAWAKAFLEELPQQRETLIQHGVERAEHFTWEAAKQQWATILSEAGLHLIPPKTREALPGKFDQLDHYIAEITAVFAQQIAERHPTMDDLPNSRLKKHLATLEHIRKQENESRLVRLPVVGVVFRLLLRLRYLGQMWNANNQMHMLLIEHIHTVESRIQALEDERRQL